MTTSPKNFPGADAISYQINTYGTDQTLLFYRKSSQSLLHLLLPNQTAQALHIVPYPAEAAGGSPEEMKQLLKQQIFNSWWNGYVLGYPEHMIDSYCHNFHSDLSQNEKISETERAKKITMEYFQRREATAGDIPRRKIQMGSEINLITEEVSRFLSKF
jgi:hypothetical protein